MKYILLITLLAIAVNPQASAQEAPKADTFKNSFGLQFGMGFGHTADEELIGIQYKRWVKPNRALRFSLMYKPWTDFSERDITHVSGDTVFSNYYLDDVDMVYLNAGIEMHKHFYKNVYLYAAIDLRGGYGSGTQQVYSEGRVYSQGGTTDKDPVFGNLPPGATHKVSRFIIDATPYIGVKFMFRRIAFGTEISAISSGIESYTTLRSAQASSTIFNMEAGLLRQRAFVNFRF